MKKKKNKEDIELDSTYSESERSIDSTPPKPAKVFLENKKKLV